MKNNSLLFFTAIATITLLSCNNGSKQSDIKNAANQPAVKCDTIPAKYKLIEEIGKRIKFEDYNASNVVSLQGKGNYQNHSEAFPSSATYAFKNYLTDGTLPGFYPIDPEAVEEQNLTWEISFGIIPVKPNPERLNQLNQLSFSNNNAKKSGRNSAFKIFKSKATICTQNNSCIQSHHTHFRIAKCRQRWIGTKSMVRYKRLCANRNYTNGI